MKKTILLLLTLTLCLTICSCGSKKEADTPENKIGDAVSEAETSKNKIGDTVSTDILEFTLDDATFAIALSNTMSLQSVSNYGAPKEYDAEKDANNPYVASKGHSLAYVSFTLNNIDRRSINIRNFVTVKYGDSIYNDDMKFIADRSWGEIDWSGYSMANILLETGTKTSYRGYIDIPVEAKPDDYFELTLALPTSAGKTTKFTFGVTPEDRDAAVEAEKNRTDELIAEYNENVETRKAEASPEVVSAVKSALDGACYEYNTYSPDVVIKHKTIFSRDTIIDYTTSSIGTTFEKEGTYTVGEKDLFVDFYADIFTDCFIPYVLENDEVLIYDTESIEQY